ncbi:MAG: hypothetical protein J6O56_05585 [Bacilli bacterium]|nr:hypothetical protein [Bacilli bacterium]
MENKNLFDYEKEEFKYFIEFSKGESSIKSKSEKKNMKILEYYNDILNSLNNGVNLQTIENMIEEDYMASINNKQSNIKSEEDYKYLQIALNFIKSKLEYIENHNKYKDTYYDKCISEKNELQKILDSGISLENLQTLLEMDFYRFYCNNEMSLEYIIEGAEAEALDFNEVEIFALDGFSDAYNNPTGTKSFKDRTIKKLAFNLLKKENN